MIKSKKSYHFSFLLCIISPLLFSLSSRAQTCNCTYTLSPGTYVQFNGSGNNGKPKVKPGDVICLKAGTYGRLRMDSIVGSEANPVVIKNCGGKVNVVAGLDDTFNTFTIINSKYFRLTGTGVSNVNYGIYVEGGRNGIVLAERSTNFEMDHCEINKVAFAAVMAKTDPVCDKPYTWRNNFTMYNVKIHDNYAHDTYQGEGFYIGNSFYNTGSKPANCADILFPHDIINLELYGNMVKRTGAEGIQVGSATVNAKIYNNRIDSAGIASIPFQTSYQNNGLQLGGGTGGLCFNNIINFCPGNGILCTGIGDNSIYNNVIINAGQTDSTSGSGIFADEQNTPNSLVGNGVLIMNNTIINPKDNGIRIYMDRIKNENRIYNNIIVKSGTDPEYVKKLNASVKVVEKNNVYRNSASLLFFKNSANDFTLRENSPAVDAGTTLNAPTRDILGNIRNNGNGIDVGAYERINKAPLVTIALPLTDGLVTDALNFKITANASDPDGTIKNVSFYDGTTLLGSDNTSPYSFTLPQLLTKEYTFTAKATDGNGATTTSSAVSISLKKKAGDGLSARYFNNRNWSDNPVLLRVDTSINFNWLKASPSSQIGIDNFSVKWSGKIKPLKSDIYTFTSTSDDGFMLSVNDSVIINQATYLATSSSGSIKLVAGTAYNIEVKYFENSGAAKCLLEWSSTTMAKQVVPKSVLYSESNANLREEEEESTLEEIKTEIHSIHPNPTTGSINIPSWKDGEKVTLLDTKGEIMLKTDNSGSIWIGDLPNGVYILMYQNKAHKIVKE